MKQLLFYVSVLAIVFLGANNLKAQNINFFQGNWKQAQLESQKQNKPIFMDAYASWCEPCKRMDREIFSKPEVAKFFNDNFVNVKFDMEKGDGLPLAKTHQVKFYPTYLFFSTEGILVHRGGGYIEAGDFITLGSNSLNENTQYYTLKNTYDYGTRTPDLLYKFAMAAVEASMGDAGTISEEYLQGLAGSKKLLSTENMKLIMQVAQDFNNTAFDIMSQNTAKFVETFGAEKVHTVLGNAMRQKVAEAGKKGNTTAMDEALKFVDANMSDKARRLKPELSMIYFEANKDWAAYCNAAPDYVTLNLMDDAVGLNNVAWNFFEHATDAEQLEDAIKWSKRSISLSNKYYNNDTYTNLLYKAKQYNEAWAAAKITLEKAEKEQVDSKETLNLLFKMAPDMKSEGIEYLLANKAKFVDAYGEKEIDKKCHDLINASIAKAGENKDQAMYNEYVGIARRYYPANKQKWNLATNCYTCRQVKTGMPTWTIQLIILTAKTWTILICS